MKKLIKNYKIMENKPSLVATEMSAIQFIQEKLKAPKGQNNSFGNYKYRSCEDILNAVKPLLKETQSQLIISDKIVLIGDRYYVEATATLTDKNGVETKTIAYAREQLTKKGMDESQITGATSSYARKYALNGLFLIDDTRDADTMDNSVVEAPKKQAPAPKIDEKKFTEALVKINGCENVVELQKIWNGYKEFQGLNAFVKAVNNKKKELA